MIARRLRVHSGAQGVWYRDWTVTTARSFGLASSARNREDGSAEALAVGDGEAVERFIAACREGSPRSEVTHIDVEEAASNR